MAVVSRDGMPTNLNLRRTFQALKDMAHRSGTVDGEGDGCGVQVDLPRRLWRKILAQGGVSESLADDPRFCVAHCFLPRSDRLRWHATRDAARSALAAAGFRVLVERRGEVHSETLGPRARADEPEFWQLAVLYEGSDDAEAACFRFQLEAEASLALHVVSFSPHTVVYKVRGAADVLPRYFADLSDPDLETAVVIGHNRYSTNTTTVFERVQPFSLLGHNGEINTIRKMREEAMQLGIVLPPGGSDSQDVNRVLESLIHLFGFDLSEAMEVLFPPILNEVKHFEPRLQDLYMFIRKLWGPFSQGPAAVLARWRDTLVASVDALGLRPLWFIQTEEAYYLSSEQGVVPLLDMMEDPKPLAPGEKLLLRVRPGGVDVEAYDAIQRRVLESMASRYPIGPVYREALDCGRPLGGEAPLPPEGAGDPDRRERLMAAHGWSHDDVRLLQAEASTGNEPIGSLGYDGPLACLSQERQNLSEYFKESVAVVTNPAIDREREIEHFSTRALLGARPSFQPGGLDEEAVALQREVLVPVLLGGHADASPVAAEVYRSVAARFGTYLLEDVVQAFAVRGRLAHLELAARPDESVREAVERLADEAVVAARGGACLVLLDDRGVFEEAPGGGRRSWVDPHLALAAVD
ncbi:MAG: glutamate synthase, partial [Clostridia bacterium]|nr:glutamate synthase [Clostridia bacterium]